MSDIYRGYTQTSRAWYGERVLSSTPEAVDIFNIGLYSDDGGTAGEFEVQFVKLCGSVVALLRAYDDAFAALGSFGDLLGALGTREGITAGELRQLLDSLGIRDHTEEAEV